MIFEKFYNLVSQIPKGKVATYKDVAKAAGNSHAARAVGNAMACNQDTKRVPCHRVVKSSGHVGGYKGNPKKSLEKARKLIKEGIDIDLATGKIRSLLRVRFQNFKKNYKKTL